METTVDNITEMFEGTKHLLVCGVITAILGVIMLTHLSGYKVSRAPLIFLVLFLFTVASGFFGMLFSPLTKTTAKLFDVKSRSMLCLIFSFIYFLLYWFVILLLVNILVRQMVYIGSNDGDGAIKLCFAVGCFIVAIVQTTKFYNLLIE